ncbi:MAG: hypothetical protein ACT7A5_35050, partial [Ferrovibrionaceae bacterium]
RDPRVREAYLGKAQ